jgi:anthranilate phosphoribosyltransferase
VGRRDRTRASPHHPTAPSLGLADKTSRSAGWGLANLPSMTTSLHDLGGWPPLLSALMRGEHLSGEHTRAAMSELLSGNATSAQIAGFVIALRQKGETVDELSGLLDAMLDAASLVSLPAELLDRAIDIVGTGGDRSHSINVSTISMFVLAAGGITVVKHGNRAASSQCGAADLLAELGVAIELTPAEIVPCVEAAGFAFCLAPTFHPALRHAGPTRRELGVQTAFNTLGPMANPARVRRLVVGLADPSLAPQMLEVFARNGAEHVLIVHGDDGLDELTTTATSSAWELRHGETRQFTIDPTTLGLPRVSVDALRGGAPAENAALARAVLAGAKGPHRDIITLNAAAGFLVADAVPSLEDGIRLACSLLDDGSAEQALDRLVKTSNRLVAARPT